MIASGLVRYHDALADLMVDIDTLQQHPRNYNNADIDKIAESIEVNGMYRPIYVQKHTGVILAGNHTWVACKSLGADRIPVVELDIDDATANRILVGDNWIASLAIPDNALLLELLTEIDADNALLGTGVTPDDMVRLARTIDTPVPEPDDLPFKCPSCGHEWTGNPHG